MEDLPEYHSLAARESRTATYEASRRRSAERPAEREADARGGRGPSASYAEWLAEGRDPEAGQ
jgi:hypothetical protein